MTVGDRGDDDGNWLDGDFCGALPRLSPDGRMFPIEFLEVGLDWKAGTTFEQLQENHGPQSSVEEAQTKRG